MGTLWNTRSELFTTHLWFGFIVLLSVLFLAIPEQVVSIWYSLVLCSQIMQLYKEGRAVFVSLGMPREGGCDTQLRDTHPAQASQDEPSLQQDLVTGQRAPAQYWAVTPGLIVLYHCLKRNFTLGFRHETSGLVLFCTEDFAQWNRRFPMKKE